ncbi:MAG: Hpt domain-containing protein [Alphaproteobacteria bacterium]|jgi:hypothetical protein|nr:Hpt domain-containing protein [Alphaproteobacteria bacterium]
MENGANDDPDLEGLDPEAIARAEAAVAAFSDDYIDWVRDDVERLKELLRAAADDSRRGHETLDAVIRIGHNMRGQGGSFGYPLITRLASSLYEFIKSRDVAVSDEDLEIANRHIAELDTIVTRRIKGKGDMATRRRVEQVERLTAKRVQ